VISAGSVYKDTKCISHSEGRLELIAAQQGDRCGRKAFHLDVLPRTGAWICVSAELRLEQSLPLIFEGLLEHYQSIKLSINSYIHDVV